MRRLFEDPEQPLALRDELMRLHTAGRDCPAQDKLAQLQAALSASSAAPPPRLETLAHPAWKLRGSIEAELNRAP